jgi:hypothetical protein
MTEAEWLATTDCLALLIHLRGNAETQPGTFGMGLHSSSGFLAYGEASRTSRRKLRLLAATICRKWWEIPLDESSRVMLVAFEAVLNEEGSWEQFFAAVTRIGEAVQRGERTAISHMAMWDDTPHGVADLAMSVASAVANYVAGDSVAITCADATESDMVGWSFGGGPPDSLWQASRNATEAEHAPLLREIIGNPFRSVDFSASWRTDTALSLARVMYESRDFSAMPILGDALQDAGCNDDAVLDHCRGEGPHVRGCWVCDLVLGKA